jgi:hypothetical protein
MKNYNLTNIISGWVVFAISTITYVLTIEPTASLWDCGEFIAAGFKLQIGHPPGNPVFMLMTRFATFFAFGDVSKVSATVNIMSALASAFTILFTSPNAKKVANLVISIKTGFPGGCSI